jgi:hypothetical protein
MAGSACNLLPVERFDTQSLGSRFDFLGFNAVRWRLVF